MGLVAKTLMLDKDVYYETHLTIINGVLPIKLKPMEISVLAAFMALDGDIVNENRFCTSARKIVKEKLSLSDGGLGNYLKSLRDMKFIIERNNVEIILPFLIPDNKEQSYNFKLIRNN